MTSLGTGYAYIMCMYIPICKEDGSHLHTFSFTVVKSLQSHIELDVVWSVISIATINIFFSESLCIETTSTFDNIVAVQLPPNFNVSQFYA